MDGPDSLGKSVHSIQALRTAVLNPAEVSGVFTSQRGCALEYAGYRPINAKPGDVIVIGHGFLRGKARMMGFARALAEAGAMSVAVDFCNDRLWDGGHFRNGMDLIAVANALDARRVIYLGFSAGGLAALIAGRNDPRTLGVITLDLVDSADLGVGMAAGLKAPLIGLMGDPSPCNADGRGVAVYAAVASARLEHFEGASHCDFEAPTDWLCRLICGRGRNASTSGAMHAAVMSSVTGAVASLLSSQPK